MSRNKKVGRSAHPFVRDQVAELVEAYRVIDESKDDPTCINPEVEYAEDRIYIYKATALHQVLQALSGFTETGNLNPPYNERNFLIRTEYKQFLATGGKRVDAIRHLANKHNRDYRTIEDIVKRKKPMV